MDERELTARARLGDESAGRALYDAHVDRVYWLAYRLSGRHDLAQDFTQDVFIRDTIIAEMSPMKTMAQKIAAARLIAALNKQQ